MRVLLIDDLSSRLELSLVAQGFNVYSADNADESISLASRYAYDVIVQSLERPSLVRKMRDNGVQTPIIVLSHEDGIADIVSALDAGADDYIVKSELHMKVLHARIRAIVRRSKSFAQSSLTIGDLTLRLDAKTVDVDGKPLKLTCKEYEILEFLVMRKNTVQTKESILNYLYGGMDEPDLKIIDVFICKLRKKLRAASGPEVETVWGRGYIVRDTAKTESPSLIPTLDEMASA